MNSMISNARRCYRCGSCQNLQVHHCIAGAYRKKSDKYNLVVYLCAECHTGSRGVHTTREGMKWWREYLMPIAQTKFEETYGHDKWMMEFGHNFL